MSLLDHPSVADVVAIARSLTDEQIESLAALLSHGDLLLSAGSLTVQQATHLQAAEAAKVVTLLRRWHSLGQTADSLAEALLVAHATYNQVKGEGPSVRLVWTGPISTPVPVRSTLAVMLDLINMAQFEMVIVGYAVTLGASKVFEHLAVAQRKGVRAVVIGNRLEEHLPLLRTLWPPGLRLPELYTRMEAPDDHISALHAKLAIADRMHLLVTSANLTYHGLTGNIEIGLQVDGKVAEETTDLLTRLINEGVFTRIEIDV